MNSVTTNLEVSDSRNYQIEIFTLGQFVVRCGDTILSEESNKSQKLWELFKYIFANRGKSILPETIQETLWPNHEYEDSQRAFRTLIYRLRQLLKKGLPKNIDIQPIIFAHGCYKWNPAIDYWLDLEELENNYQAARRVKDTDIERAICQYKKIAELYKGNYLQESLYTEWTIPTRSFYRRLYLQAMKELVEVLNDLDRSSEVIEICEKVLLIEPLEEDFYMNLMKALLKEGKINDAKSTYEYITSVIYKELGVKPSPEMRKLYGMMKTKLGTEVEADKDNKNEMKTKKDNETESENEIAAAYLDLSSMQENLIPSPNSNGPFFCDKKTFKAIYELERRKLERTGEAIFIVLLTLKFFDKLSLSNQATTDALGLLKQVLDMSLRRGDVYTIWNQTQIVLILPGLNMESLRKVASRIEKAFRETLQEDTIVLQSRYQPLLPSSDQFSLLGK